MSKLRRRYSRKAKPSTRGAALWHEYAKLRNIGASFLLVINQAWPEHSEEEEDDCNCKECFTRNAVFATNHDADNPFDCQCRDCLLPEPLELVIRI